jgi:protein phosphatase 1L
VLVAANVGDARVVLCRGGQAVQLTVDHKPDVEAERKRIEAKNPTPKKPLVSWSHSVPLG